jgi:glycosyltransferase involved in cell wall biosynthesis
MIIAVNTRFLLSDYLEGYGYFLSEIVNRWVQQHPQHQFIFIFDRPFDERFITAPNITPVITGPPARHPLLWKWWYDVKIPAILKKYKADVFISADGFCSLTSKVPQCLVVHDLAFLHYPAFIKKSHLRFYKRYTPRFLQKAKTIITVSAFSKADISKHYTIPSDKITVVPNAAKKIFTALSYEEKEKVKDNYTAGKNYFIYTGSIHPRKNLINLLKAFSVFKKRQKSDWKLVLTGRLAWKYDHFLESLKAYKYRDDVVLTDYIGEEELTKLVAAAYTMVYPSLWEGFGVPVVEAMQSRVPVITSAGSAMEEITRGAALYANATDYQDIADKMMRLYKDEQLRNELIEKGVAVAADYNWDKTASLLWDCILKTVETAK